MAKPLRQLNESELIRLRRLVRGLLSSGRRAKAMRLLGAVKRQVGELPESFNSFNRLVRAKSR